MNMSQLELLIKEIETLPIKDFMYVWEKMQDKIKQLFVINDLRTEKRPFALCKDEFQVTDSFFEPLPDEIYDMFNGKND